MTATRPDVSVIVVNYNGRAWLDVCLASLAAQRDVPAEVVLIDNGSSDGSAAFVAERFPSVRLVRLDRNLGFAGGNNAGARQANGRLLAFVNNDTEVDPRWVSTLKAVFDRDSGVGLATSRIVYLHDSAVIDSAGDGYTRSGGAFKRGHGQPDSAYRDAAEVFGACGAAFMIRRELFETLGGFDEDFFLVYEDVDLSYRAQLLNARCAYVPDAIVRHAGSGTMGTVSRLSVFFGQRNLEWVYLKNTPWPLLLATLPGHLIYSLAGGLYLMRAGHFRTWISAKLAALSGLPSVLRKRRRVQRSRRTELRRLWALMDRGWLGLKWREKRFDAERAGGR
ncbi:MAG: glycosyltransferase family 2 protein [Acidobacteria bacterium]|nr:glycosyltransferase family 2 protein [Acidobacteriota bacterium]